MLDLLITNATIVTVNKEKEIITNGAIAVKDNKIVNIGSSSELRKKYPSSKQVIDATGKVIFPGLINTHNHLFQVLYKGLGDDRLLSDWLTQVTFPISIHLTPEDVYLAALTGCMDGLHSGTTTMFDYMDSYPYPEIPDMVIEAFRQVGIRGIFGRGYLDTGREFGSPPELFQDLAAIEKDMTRLLTKYHNSEKGRIKIWLAPAAVWSSSMESLKMTSELAKAYRTQVAVHISETPFDRESSKKLYGVSDIDVLEKVGLMGPDLLMVHCVHLTPRDIRMTKHYDAKISHNPISNMYLSSGVAPIPAMLEAGITVGLATDGAGSNNSNDMLEVLKMTALLHKVEHKDPTIVTAEKVLEMATIDAAKALGLDNEIGSLEIGKKADIIIFDPAKSAKAVPMHHPVSTLVYSSSQANIDTVIVDGMVVLERGSINTVDEPQVLYTTQIAADKLCQRANICHLKNRLWRSFAY